MSNNTRIPTKPFNLTWERIQPYILLMPALSLILLLFGGGLSLALGQSLGDPPGSVAAYQRVLSDPEWIRALGISIYVALVATALSTVLSVGLALLLRTLGQWASFWCQLTLPLPHLVGIVGILLLLSPSGWLARIAFHLGWIQSDQDFPLLVNDPWYVGALLLFLWKETPFISLILLAVLRGLGSGYETQARVLGATPWQVFWQVTLPLLKPGILSASVLVFGFVFGSFEVPLLLGPTAPRTLPVLIYRAFTDTDLTHRADAIALGLMFTSLSIGLVGLYFFLSQGLPQSQSMRSPTHERVNP